MRIFLTRYYDENGDIWTGNRIHAISYEEAELLTEGTGLYIIGELVAEYDGEGEVTEINPELN